LPKEGQVAVTIPTYIWELVKRYFEANKEELKKRGIKSPTRLLCVWILESYAEQRDKLHKKAEGRETSV